MIVESSRVESCSDGRVESSRVVMEELSCDLWSRVRSSRVVMIEWKRICDCIVESSRVLIEEFFHVLPGTCPAEFGCWRNYFLQQSVLI